MLMFQSQLSCDGTMLRRVYRLVSVRKGGRFGRSGGWSLGRVDPAWAVWEVEQPEERDSPESGCPPEGGNACRRRRTPESRDPPRVRRTPRKQRPENGCQKTTTTITWQGFDRDRIMSLYSETTVPRALQGTSAPFTIKIHSWPR